MGISSSDTTASNDKTSVKPTIKLGDWSFKSKDIS